MKAHQRSFGKRHLNAKLVMPLYYEDSQILVLVLNSTDVSVDREDRLDVRGPWLARLVGHAPLDLGVVT